MNILDRYCEELSQVVTSPRLIEFFKGISVVEVDSDEATEADPKSTIYVGQDLNVQTCLEMALLDGAMHFVQENRQDVLFDLFASCVMLKQPTKFLENPIPFFINSFRPGHDVDTYRSKTIEISSSVEKILLIHGLKSFFKENPKTLACQEKALVVADELLMNAMFHGPVDKNGRPRFSHLDRSKEVDLGEQKVKVFISHDNERLLIGCEDPFGSLDYSQVIRNLRKQYSMPQAKIREAGKLGGLGLKLALESSIGFYIVVKKNVRTLICCAIPLGISERKAEEYPKNFHFCAF